MNLDEIKLRLTSFRNSYGFGGETVIDQMPPHLISGSIFCPETRLTLKFAPGTLPQIEAQIETFAKQVEEASARAAEEQRELEIETSQEGGGEK